MLVAREILDIGGKVAGLSGFVAAALFLIFRQIIAKDIFPQLTQAVSGNVIMAIIDRIYKVALVAMVLGFLSFVVSKFVPTSRAEPSLTSNLPDNLSLKSAISMIVDDDRSTADFRSSCTGPFLATKIRGGILRARTSADLIEQLNYRLVGAKTNFVVRARKDDARGTYEIDCIK
jgi:hypothetical protein